MKFYISLAAFLFFFFICTMVGNAQQKLSVPSKTKLSTGFGAVPATAPVIKKEVSSSSTSEQKENAEREANPEQRALNLLNTKTTPADFPRYDKSTMTSMDYEAKVAAWFRKNPDKRKRN